MAHEELPFTSGQGIGGNEETDVGGCLFRGFPLSHHLELAVASSREPTPVPTFVKLFSIKHSLNYPNLSVLAVSCQDPDNSLGMNSFLTDSREGWALRPGRGLKQQCTQARESLTSSGHKQVLSRDLPVAWLP